MKFKQATDALLESVTLEDLANSLGVSVQTVRQARAAEESTAYRSPPKGWEAAVAKLADTHARQLSRLSKHLAGNKP
jgi:hypothetical protein